MVDDVWTVQFTMDGLPAEDFRREIQEKFDAYHLDASVSAIPQHDQWVISFGVDAADFSAALHEAEAYAVKVDVVPADPVAVEVFNMAELERRAEEPTMPQLVGASEVAELLNVTRQRVHQLRSLPAFPAPLVEVAMGPLWDQRAVEKFSREWERKPGRPSPVSRVNRAS